MKKITYILFFSAIIFSSCNSTTAQKNGTTKEEVNTFLDNWHKAAANANFKNYFNAMDSISVFVGTDASENWTKSKFKNFSKPFFDKGKAWAFKPIERNIYFNDTKNFIWFDELLTTWMGTCRGSGVIEKKGNQLKIKHYVLSLTIPNDNVNEVVRINRKKDSLFLKNKLNN